MNGTQGDVGDTWQRWEEEREINEDCKRELKMRAIPRSEQKK